MHEGGGSEADRLRAKAQRCLRLANWINDAEARAALRNLAAVYEIKAKRIKKIKSKAYRRVHRKERQKNALSDQKALAEAGLIDSEDEQERMDRRRAEERMGQRHKESRWAKGVKETGRAKWDDEARDGVTAMLRQDEELSVIRSLYIPTRRPSS